MCIRARQHAVLFALAAIFAFAGRDLVGDLLAQFHAELVEGIDAPHQPLHRPDPHPQDRGRAESGHQDEAIGHIDQHGEQNGQPVARQPASLPSSTGLSRSNVVCQ